MDKVYTAEEYRRLGATDEQAERWAIASKREHRLSPYELIKQWLAEVVGEEDCGEDTAILLGRFSEAGYEISYREAEWALEKGRQL